MFSAFTDRIVYAAPPPTYQVGDFEGTLCYIPWSDEAPLPGIRPTTSSTNGCTGSLAGSGDIQGVGVIGENEAGYLPCLWLPAPRSANVLFYFHANAEDLGIVHAGLVHLRKQLQVSVLAVEYPGYGLLKDMSPTEENICRAAMLALRYIVSEEVGANYDQVMVIGRSLGSGPAVYLASRFPVAGLILVNPVASIRKAAESHLGKVLGRLAFSNYFNNTVGIRNVSCPVLFIHGANDRTVPVEHSAQLFQLCRSRKLLVTPAGMTHNSHLFEDPQFLAVPAIHFFHFPCYTMDNPPGLPAKVFTPPKKDTTSASLAGCRYSMPWLYRLCAADQYQPEPCAGDGESDDIDVPANAAILGNVHVDDELRKKTPRKAAANLEKEKPEVSAHSIEADEEDKSAEVVAEEDKVDPDGKHVLDGRTNTSV